MTAISTQTKRAVISIIAALFVILSGLGQPMTAQSKRFEIGPIFKLNPGMGRPNRQRVEAELRGFIWDHWQSKRRAKVAVQICGFDTCQTQTFTIRPEEGQWILVSTLEKRNGLFFWRKDKRTQEVFNVISRVEPATTPRPFDPAVLPCFDSIPGARFEPITDSQARSPADYRLYFQSLSKPDTNWFF